MCNPVEFVVTLIFWFQNSLYYKVLWLTQAEEVFLHTQISMIVFVSILLYLLLQSSVSLILHIPPPPPICITFNNSASPLLSHMMLPKWGGEGGWYPVYLLLFFVVLFRHSLFGLYFLIPLGCFLWNMLSFFSFCSFICVFECVNLTCLMSFSFLTLSFLCCISLSLFHSVPPSTNLFCPFCYPTLF